MGSERVKEWGVRGLRSGRGGVGSEGNERWGGGVRI